MGELWAKWTPQPRNSHYRNVVNEFRSKLAEDANNEAAYRYKAHAAARLRQWAVLEQVLGLFDMEHSQAALTETHDVMTAALPKLQALEKELASAFSMRMTTGKEMTCRRCSTACGTGGVALR